METSGVLTRDDFRFITQVKRLIQSVIQSESPPECLSYLMYFDTAVASYWRAMAMPYHDTMVQLGGDLYVRKATLEYHRSARYDDLLHVGMRCVHIGNSSMRFEAGCFKGDDLLVSGELVYVFANPATQTSLPVPTALREALQAFAAGEPMARVEVGDWARLREPARALRTAVFVDEQRIPLEIELDAADDTAVHAVAFNRFGNAVATGRLLQPAPGVAKIGRMAVHQAVRGSGVGRQVLEALIDTARARGDQEVLLHAQTAVQDFYLRAGFRPRGEVFVEAGIPHLEMTRAT